MTSEDIEKTSGFEVNFEFVEYNGEDGIDVRTILLGDDPIVLIEPVEDGSSEVRFKITTSMIGLKDLQVVLEYILEATKKAQLEEAESTKS